MDGAGSAASLCGDVGWVPCLGRRKLHTSARQMRRFPVVTPRHSKQLRARASWSRTRALVASGESSPCTGP